MKNAPTRVNNPSKINIPPISSDNAAADNQSHVGRIKLNGVLFEMKVLSPGPLKLPSTFCAPCAIITAPSARRIGRVNHVGEVAISLRNMTVASSSDCVLYS